MLNLMSFSSANFAAYAPESAYTMNEINDMNQLEKPEQNLTADKIPPLISLSIGPPVLTKNMQETSISSISVVKENIEPLPFPQNRPGPIQRPPKLKYSSNTALSSFFPGVAQSPSTPDVLVEINHLLDHQNSIATIISTPNIVNSLNASVVNDDVSVINTPWTHFSPPEWSSKYDSSWSTTNIQHTPQTVAQRVQNPLLQSQISRDDSSVWSLTSGTTRPTVESLSISTQKVPSEWNEIFSSPTTSSSPTTETLNNSWLKFLPAFESSSVDSTALHKHENETNNPLWNLINSSEAQQSTTPSWWLKTSSDDKNNNDNDQSRWDFAR